MRTSNLLQLSVTICWEDGLVPETIPDAKTEGLKVLLLEFLR